MGNLFSIALIITNIYQFIWSYFGKGKKGNANDEPVDRFYTPPRAQSRASNRDFKNANERAKRTSSQPKSLPSRLPKTFPLKRNPSQISLLGSSTYKSTPLRPQAIKRNRGSTTNLQSTPNDVFQRRIFPVRNAIQDDLALDFGGASRGSTSSIFDFHSTMGDLSNSDLHLRDSLREWRIGKAHPSCSDASTTIHRDTGVRARRLNSVPNYIPSRVTQSCPSPRIPSRTSSLGSNKCTPFKTKGIRSTRGSSTNLRNLTNNALDFSFQESGSKIARRKASLQDYRFIPAAKDQVDMQLNDGSPECCDDFIIRNLRFRSNPHSAPGCTLPYKNKGSKIPIPVRRFGRYVNPNPVQLMNLTGRPRGWHTIKKGMSGYQDFTDTPCINRFDLINNVFTFRNDSNMKFERLFKSLSKRKHRSATSIIDAATHVHWMELAGIDVDQDAIMFKNFAGGKIVLTLGEYKFFLRKISSAHGMDYWDVLQKMTNFDEEEE